MAFRHFYLLALLAVSATAIIDCSLEDTCFGEPFDCDPNTECNSLFHFDIDGNLHLYLRDFTDSHGYAAFAVNRRPDEIIEYFICLPHQEQRLRALAEMEGVVLVTEQYPAGSIESLGNNSFRCSFDVSELPERFQQEQLFFVSKGTFEETLVIRNGAQLYNLERGVDSDEDFEMDEVIPTIHHIGSPIHRRAMEEVFTSDDKETVSDAINKLPKSSKSRADLEMEKLANSQRHFRSKKAVSRRSEEQDDDDIEEEQKPRRRTNTKARRHEDVEDVEEEEQEESRPRRRQNTRAKSRPTRYEENDEDVMEDDEDEEDHRPRTRKNKRPTRFHDDDEDLEDTEEESDDVPKRRSNKKSRRNDEDDEEIDERRRKSTKGKKNKTSVDDEDDYENEDNDESYDDEENSSNNKDNLPFVSFLLVIMGYFL